MGVFVLVHRVFVLVQGVLGLRSSFLGLRFSNTPNSGPFVRVAEPNEERCRKGKL